ncbi:BTAD domain-containing putative transcriptional regulator [Streptomyces sp. NPDC017943]|uniref:BTAD domain-containing putative transcriptional regulator n=1 Tax=Streptomyces sp. NPDC017943 TaxID=3365019 RepID=UPI0037AF7E9A
MLLDAGRVVSVDALKDALWGGAPPVSAHASLHNHVARLRRLLDDPARLRTVPSGYVLRVGEGELDVDVFDTHVAAARAAHLCHERVRVVREVEAALALWRGAPLAGLPPEVGGYALTHRLREARLLLLEWRYDAELALGGPRLDELVPELAVLTDEYPLREAYHRQLMLALHRTGRRAEALAVHTELRTRLVDRLGIEPGPGVRAAHVEVLRGAADPSGHAPVPSHPPAPVTGGAALPSHPPASVTGGAALPSHVPAPGHDPLPPHGPAPVTGGAALPSHPPASVTGGAALPSDPPAPVAGDAVLPPHSPAQVTGRAPVPSDPPAPVTGRAALPPHSPAPVTGRAATPPSASTGPGGRPAAPPSPSPSPSAPLPDPAADRPSPPPSTGLGTSPGPGDRPAAPAPPAAVPPRPSPRPAQLPPAPLHFTGRLSVRDALRRTLADAGPCPTVVVSGMAGVGKSALALVVAHALAKRFPDGQLHLDLHGATPGRTPLSTGQALTVLLRDLGVEPCRVPACPDAASALLRSLLAPTRTLLVLDGATSAAQVRPLLPGGAGCAVLVTSRSPLTALDGAARFPLAPLSEEESAELLRVASGREDLGTSRAARLLVARTGRLPLALRIVAARLAARPALTPERLAGQLADGRERLRHLEYDDLSVRRSLAVTYDALTASERTADRDAALVLRRIGALGLPACSAGQLAPLTGLDARRTEAALDRLCDVALLEETAYGRYTPHDLVRDFAREPGG